jgi:hypothetical protein
MMIRRPTARRPGLSLMEVLVGFGILGIGVTSVITLFPFSALTLGQAMRDDRTVTCAVTADHQLREIHFRNVVDREQGGPKNSKGKQPPAPASEPYFARMDDGGNQPGLPALPASFTGPSYPVFVDPMGMFARGGIVGDAQLTRITRVNLKFINDYAAQLPAPTPPANLLALRFCSQMDGLNFKDDGSVDLTKLAEVRELRYNWLWVVQRPVNRDRYTARMQVVVFDKRTHQYAPSSAETELFVRSTGNPATQSPPLVAFTPGDTVITNVPATAELRKGGWVMDAGNIYLFGNDPNRINVVGVPAPSEVLLRHAEFYRIVSVSTNPNNGTLSLEVHRPISRPDGGTAPYSGMLVSMPSVADVFERPQLTGSTPP